MLELHDVMVKPLQQTLSLTVDGGQLVCISGPKGAGKTTVLRAVMGMQPIAGGYISIDGELLTPLSASYFRKYMGYVPTRLVPIPGQERVADVCRLLFGLSENRDVKTDEADDRLWHELTLAEQYLTLLAMVARQKRRLYLIDEPPVVLEGVALNAVLDCLRELTASGASVLMANNQLSVSYLANNVILLK